jgi:hypothetical protein
MARLGSLAAAVDLPEPLRPWALAGVELLYLPDGLPQTQPVAAGDYVPGPVFTERPRSDAAWPEPWGGLARRARTRPRVIITYDTLYEDMTGAGDPIRRKVFHSVLSYLAWPAGTSLFWPVCAAQEGAGAGVDAAAVFAQGVAHFDIGHIAAFGDRATTICRKLFPQDEAKPSVVVHSLPAPDALAGLLPHELQRKLAGLKALAFT